MADPRPRALARTLISGRRALLVRTAPLVLILGATKLLVDRLGWEFIEATPLHTSIVAGAIFIIGLMLSGIMSDYKESERLPTDTAAAIETIYRDGAYVKELYPDFDLAGLTERLARIPHHMRADLLGGGKGTVEAAEDLTASFLEMDRLGVPPNYITRLKQEQALVVRNLMRAAYIQRISFLPSAYTLVEIMLALLITLLMFTRVSTRMTDAILLGFISLIFLYILGLLRVLDSPFRASGAGPDDVSLFQIDDIRETMLSRLAASGVSGGDHHDVEPSRGSGHSPGVPPTGT